MIRLSPLFIDILAELGLYEELQLFNLRRDIKKLINPPLLFHIYPLHLKNGRLIISVDSNEWLHEINLHKVELIKRFSDYGVKDIRFKLGKVPKEPSTKTMKESNHHKEMEIPPELHNSICKNIKDSHLRETLIKAIKVSLSKSKPYADSRSFS